MSTGQPMLAAAIAAMFWAVSAAAEDPPGAKPGDAAMTCEQIAAELAPYAQRMMPSAMAAGQAANAAVERGQQRAAEAMPGAAALTVAATAATADPTGVASRAVGQAEMAYQDEVTRRSLAEDKPVYDKLAATTGAVAAQGRQLQSDARLQRLMQLVQDKHCDRK